jgi:hypothetical protein
MKLSVNKNYSELTCTVNSSSDYTLWTLHRCYIKGISANIELQVQRHVPLMNRELGLFK